MMNREKILQLAREAQLPVFYGTNWVVDETNLILFAQLIERELTGDTEPIGCLRQWRNEEGTICQVFQLFNPEWEGECKVYTHPTSEMAQELVKALKHLHHNAHNLYKLSSQMGLDLIAAENALIKSQEAGL